MLLEKTGLQIDLKDPVDIAHHQSLGWTPVAGIKVSEKKVSEAEEKSKESEKPSAGVELALESLELEFPEDLSDVTDEELLAIKGIGKGALKSIRADYPLEEGVE